MNHTNFVLQYHTLQSDWLKLGEHLGVSMPNLEHLNKQRDKEQIKQNYVEFYENDTRDIVEEMCAPEIEHYEYTFGGQ